MEDENFGFECCWTCEHCILDIETHKYICQKCNTIVTNIHYPKQCEFWTR